MYGKLEPIAKWEGQGEFNSPGDEGACPPESVMGDNPGGYPTAITLPDEGDIRNPDNGRNSNPTPEMPGAGSKNG